MALDTYAGLQAAIARDLGNRSDVGPRVVDWIYLLEQELNLLLSRREMMQRATANTVIGEDTLALPADYGGGDATLHVNGSPITWVEPSNWGRIKLRYQNFSGLPTEWSITQNEILLGRTPDKVYEVELYYQKTLPNLSATVPTNWLLAKHPNVYYFGTLNYAARSITVDAADAQRWTSSYDEVRNALVKQQVKDRGFGGGPLLQTDIPLPSGSARTGVNILTGDA